jgi:hemolysin activation/secretion protein
MLPDTEKFSLGGPGSVRAFRPSEVRGDSGYLATVELRRPFTVAGRLGAFRITADAGEVIYKAPGFTDSRDRLRSIGVGASFFPARGITASIDIARPMGATHTASDDKNHRIWVNVSASF